VADSTKHEWYIYNSNDTYTNVSGLREYSLKLKLVFPSPTYCKTNIRWLDHTLSGNIQQVITQSDNDKVVPLPQGRQCEHEDH